MVISQGEVWWADLADPIGSAPGFRRPVLIVQCDALNQSRVATVVCVSHTSNLKWSEAPGNVLLSARATQLPKDSVANVSQFLTWTKRLSPCGRRSYRSKGFKPCSTASVWCWVTGEGLLEKPIPQIPMRTNIERLRFAGDSALAMLAGMPLDMFTPLKDGPEAGFLGIERSTALRTGAFGLITGRRST